MSAQQIYTAWMIWLAVGTVIVLVAAALLLTVVVLARRIGALAATALSVVEDIEQNTQPIWLLQSTNQVAGELLAGAHAIGNHAATIAAVLPGRDRAVNG